MSKFSVKLFTHFSKQEKKKIGDILVISKSSELWKKHLFRFEGSRMISKEDFYVTNKIGLEEFVLESGMIVV